MLKIESMRQEEIAAMLSGLRFGHLGCCRDGHPYVVPMHYAFDGKALYFFTTEGTKTEFISANKEVCFQVEEIADDSHWRSVMIIGDAHRLTHLDEIERAVGIISERNPSLTPALNRTDIGAWHRRSNLAVYRVEPSGSYGRKTI